MTALTTIAPWWLWFGLALLVVWTAIGCAGAYAGYLENRKIRGESDER